MPSPGELEFRVGRENNQIMELQLFDLAHDRDNLSLVHRVRCRMPPGCHPDATQMARRARAKTVVSLHMPTSIEDERDRDAAGRFEGWRERCEGAVTR